MPLQSGKVNKSPPILTKRIEGLPCVSSVERQRLGGFGTRLLFMFFDESSHAVSSGIGGSLERFFSFAAMQATAGYIEVDVYDLVADLSRFFES